jgi:tRNA(fMet)-specific endonuclease VapC
MPADCKRITDRANGILLDTSAVIAHLRGGIDVLALTKPTEPLFLPLVALGELYKGAEKSKRSVHNRQLVDDFLKIAALLYPDSATAESYAKTAVGLESQARSSLRMTSGLPPSRLKCDMPLATRDAHFQRVEGLTVIQW